MKRHATRTDFYSRKAGLFGTTVTSQAVQTVAASGVASGAILDTSGRQMVQGGGSAIGTVVVASRRDYGRRRSGDNRAVSTAAISSCRICDCKATIGRLTSRYN
jgi:autotransporter passenger strand-loop-strand repeat protein